MTKRIIKGIQMACICILNGKQLEKCNTDECLLRNPNITNKPVNGSKGLNFWSGYSSDEADHD